MKRSLAVGLISTAAIMLSACDKYGDNYILLDLKTKQVSSHLKDNLANQANKNIDGLDFSNQIIKNCSAQQMNEAEQKVAKGAKEWMITCKGIKYIVTNIDVLKKQ